VRLHGRSNLAAYDPVVFDRILNCLQTREVATSLANLRLHFALQCLIL
jgi:hypothetical protein